MTELTLNRHVPLWILHYFSTERKAFVMNQQTINILIESMILCLYGYCWRIWNYKLVESLSKFLESLFLTPYSKLAIYISTAHRPIRMAADPQPKVCNFTIADCGKAFSAGKRPIIILSVLLAIVFLLAVVSITLGNQEMRRLREQGKISNLFLCCCESSSCE